VKKSIPKPLRAHRRKWHASVTPAAAVRAPKDVQTNSAIFRRANTGIRLARQVLG